MHALPGSALDATVPAPQWVSDWWLPETEMTGDAATMSVELEGVAVPGSEESRRLLGSVEVAGREVRPEVGEPAR